MNLVSVTIPTKDSQNTIKKCIQSIRDQTYPDIEIIVVDTLSQDDTVEICKGLGCEVLSTDWKLLGSRYLGMEASKGEYILMIDSDQILKNDIIERCMKQTDAYDMLCLEEKSSSTTTVVERMFQADRRLVQRELELQFDPVYGTMLARFYKRNLLRNAFEAIPKYLLPIVVAHDHAIIYYEAYRISNKVGMIPEGVLHREPGIVELWRKNFRYGKSTKFLLSDGYYRDLLSGKIRFRKTSSNFSIDKLLSSLLLFIKAPPYLAGLYL